MKHLESFKELAGKSMFINHPIIKLLKIVCILFAFGFKTAFAADIIYVQPVTNKILEVFFNEGHIDYYAENENWNTDNKLYYSPLKVSAAENIESYLIKSNNHRAYFKAVQPVKIGRKSKSLDANFPGANPEFLLGHWMYLELPVALESGKTYTISFNKLADNRNEYSFIFDEKKLRSNTIHVNQIGFAKDAPKIAYLSHWMGTMGGLKLDDFAGKKFEVMRESDCITTFEGVIRKRMDAGVAESTHDDFGITKNNTLADVFECDFSNLKTPGEYIVSIKGMGCSYPFEINNDIVREPFFYAMKGIFYQRQGIVKEIENGKVYPRDHHPDDIKWFYDPEFTSSENTKNFKFTNQVKGIWGFYHDAGDWDSYPRHISVPYTLCLLYSLAPDKFADGDVSNRYKLSSDDSVWIDEGTNGIPDVLDEAQWLINGYRRAREVLQKQGLCDGGVPGYIGRDAINWQGSYGQGMIPSWEDKRDWAVAKATPQTTMSYAAAAAWYASCLNAFWHLKHPGQDHPQSSEWIAEAKAAYQWAVEHNNSTGRNIKILGSVCLYSVTAEPSYLEDFKTAWNQDNSKDAIELSGVPNTLFAAAVYALLPSGFPHLDGALQDEIKAYIIQKGDNLVARTNEVGYRYGSFSKNSPLSVGMFSTPHVTSAAVAYKLTGDKKYLDAINHVTSYCLGGNQLNLVHLSGLGENPDNCIFHPDMWMLNDANSLVYSWEPLPGYVTYFGVVKDWINGGPGSEKWARTSAYPPVDQWPCTEARFFDRESIAGGEYTVTQNNAPAFFSYGFLRAVYSSPDGYEPKQRPQIKLHMNENSTVKTNRVLKLTVDASSNTRSVKYFYDWHFIGESTDRQHNFAYDWHVNLPGKERILITGVGYNDRGKITLPSKAAEKTAKITD